MAFTIPESIENLPNVTPGEARVFRLLKTKLPDDVLVWYDVPVRGRYSDFIVLHPRLGVLVLEVKDWSLDTIRAITPNHVVLNTPAGEKTVEHPLKQARACVHKVVSLLESATGLVQNDARHKGRLVCPFGYGVIWTNLKESAFKTTFGGLIDPFGMLFRESLAPSIDPIEFSERLAGLFPVHFEFEFTRAQIDRIRWLLFPEIRLPRNIPSRQQPSRQTEPTLLDDQQPDDRAMLAVMDYEQERLAKNLGDGHRLVRGVAGSGKTWTLVCRARLLAKLHPKWRILVLCYNATLAAWLEQTIQADPDVKHHRKLEIRTFHSWLNQSASAVGLPSGKFSDGDVSTTATAVQLTQLAEQNDRRLIRYDAILIDEAHDFPSEWLKLAVSRLNPETDSLFIVYDGAQNIYRRGFSFSKVGIKVRGRTRLLRTNYRNTRQIAEFATEFLGRGVRYTEEELLRDDEGQLLEIVRPATSARTGSHPLLVQCERFREECAEAAARAKLWIERDHLPPQEILIVYVKKGATAGDERYVKALLGALDETGIAYEWIARDWRTKRAFRSDSPTVKVSTIHSAKGLDFDTVVMVGVSLLPSSETAADLERKLVYIGLTRARRQLVVTWCKESAFVAEMKAILSRKG